MHVVRFLGDGTNLPCSYDFKTKEVALAVVSASKGGAKYMGEFDSEGNRIAPPAIEDKRHD